MNTDVIQRPKMILFDFGGTLVSERFSPIKGNQALLNRAVKNPRNVSAEDIQALAARMSQDMGANDDQKNPLEIHMFQFQRYLYEYFGIEFDSSPSEIEDIFINGSMESTATTNIKNFLSFLDEMKIRTGVISNMTFSGEALNKWIDHDLPFRKFEFVITSSEYVFRKPSRYIFEIALRKAGLNAGEVWYCGNNFLCDVLGSFNAGIQPVWYKGAKWEDNGGGASCPYIEISDWNELKEIISNTR